ncbi:MAG: hybrid sensor histidine kinase/response regulator [Bacteroidota bacterium]
MDLKPKAVKYKVIIGYVLLFATAVASIWFAYNEILKIALPGQENNENDKIIKISNTVADLYASEAMGRNALMTGKPADFKKYIKLTDTINTQISLIKQTVDSIQSKKFDSIQLLVSRKKDGIIELLEYRKKYARYNTFTKAIDGIYYAKDSIWDKTKPIRPTKKYQWNSVVDKLLTPKQRDSLSKLDVSNDTLTMAYRNVIQGHLIKDEKLRTELYKKEEQLLEENRIISDQIRVILTSVENEFFQKSYARFEDSRSMLNKTVETMAWVGAITLLLIIIFATVIVRDLSQNQNYRRQLELLNQENQELLRSKSMLMATVTHDLQTPLGSILGFQELIKNSGVTGKQKQYLANIKDSADYILKLVNDLLDFSRLENNRITIENTGFNFKNAVEATCRTLEPIALEKNIELNWDIADELNGNYISDPYRIKQVLTNLISNAVKFTHEGSVEVTARIEGFDIVLSVIDTGIGIAPDNHDAVFKEFTQAHDGIEKKFGGTGLGLTISKRIIELLDGKIFLESKEGQGSIFTIILPCIAARNTPQEELQNEPVKTKNGVLPAGTSILVVDDDSVQLMLMKEILQQYGAEVTTEINAVAVPRLLEKEYFDVVLTDIQMPVLDGFSLLKKIRAHEDEGIAAMPIIALSGRKDLTEEDFSIAGFTSCHNKPVNIERLLQVICQALTDGKTTFVAHHGIENHHKNTSGLYSLSSLSQFTNKDPASLKTILETFIESTKDNCSVLKEAAADNDADKLMRIAHKMIPMLRQMEVHSIANLLLPLEESTLDFNAEEMAHYADDICKRLVMLCNSLEMEMEG